MRDELKKRAAERAVQFVRSGQVVGLGTGSTTRFAILELGRRVQSGLKITGVPTSKETEQLALSLGIPLSDFNQAERIDISIDGADEVDPDFQMIKGGGGALTREKLVAIASAQSIIIVDNEKLVPVLGRSFRLPVEVLPFAWRLSERRLAELGCEPEIRERDGRRFETDNGNYILDCKFEAITEAASLERKIKLLPGVVECGLFIGLLDTLIIGHAQDVEVRSVKA